MGQFVYEKDADGVVTITIDLDGAVNTVGEEFLLGLEEVVTKLKADSDLQGVIFTSAKDTFVAGGDLEKLLAAETEEDVKELYDYVQSFKALQRDLEKLPVPVAAAINGSALGGGLELCLACNYRVAADRHDLRVGLPEVGLGLMPGAGGCVRMVYLLGVQGAMPYCIEGKQLRPQQAVDAGIIHKVVSADELLADAKAWVLGARGNKDLLTQPWDTKGYRVPGGISNAPKNLAMISGGTAMMFQKTRGLMPAPARILDVMVEAAGRLDFESALRYESRRFVGLPLLPETKNMIASLFFGLNKVNGGASRPKGVPKSKVKRVGILGAGMMGQGIAYCAAVAGIDVVLKDISLQAAEKGKAYTAKLFDKKVARGHKTEAEKEEILARITATDQKEPLEGCDLIIEAVFERIDIKDKVLAEHQELLAEGGIWASNTSTLPITRLSQSSNNAAKFIGMHFFSPVDKMPLLEIVVGEETSDETLARSFDFARQIKKTPIVVNDSVGFYTSRTFGSKLEEAAQLVAEGIEPMMVENLSRATGLPTGLLSLHDEVSLSLTRDVYETQVEMGLRDPKDDATPAAREFLHEMVGKHDRKGKAHGGGYFDYGSDGKRLWDGLSAWRKEGHAIPDQDVKDRIIFRAVIESLVVLEEGVLRSVADANIGSIMGIGAPVQTGGYLQYVNTYGVQRFKDRCDELAAAYGERFAPPAILQEHAADNRPFV
ncbi:MAG: enoyl-CoA hydratase/isomerase family protein [Parvularculaceae bacterium]|nr:enoyl-CoA hydratase/isomerase family protein [Parvularculaceae bacterium]